ncbi:MAG: hypothetical protein OHK0017_12010 [Patescibacteria group bacterium]
MSGSKNSEKNPSDSLFYAYLFGELNFDSAQSLVYEINRANNDPKVEEIVLTICSGGGFLRPAFAIYDAIKNSNKKITAIASGFCASASLMVLQAATTRKATKNTRFMIHLTNNMVDRSTNYDEFLFLTEDYEQNHKLCMELSGKGAGLTGQEFEDLAKPRKYLTVEEALKFGKLGLIDAII